MRILAIGAHPDDVELLCAGTIARYGKEGHEIFICHVCDGNKGSMIHTSEELVKIRRSESKNSAKEKTVIKF